MYPDLKYPWQQLLLDAYLEFDPVRLPLKLNQAERAISKRLTSHKNQPLPLMNEQRCTTHCVASVVSLKNRNSKNLVKRGILFERGKGPGT